MRNVTSAEGSKGWNYMSFFSFFFTPAWLYFTRDRAGQAPRTQFKRCWARWACRRPCPLNSQPPRILHRPSNPGGPAPSGRGSRGRTPKSEWLFQDSVAVETGCTGLGGPLHHPPATQPMAGELHPGLRAPSRAPPPAGCRQPTNGHVP